jgi:hypothetical protein
MIDEFGWSRTQISAGFRCHSFPSACSHSIASLGIDIGDTVMPMAAGFPTLISAGEAALPPLHTSA